MPALLVIATVIGALSTLLAGCTPEPKLSVATSVGRSVARPVLSAFTRQTGTAIDLKMIDTDGSFPDQFDVVWSDNPAATIEAAQSGRLARLPDDVLSSRPAGYVGGDGTWIAVTADVRVIVYDPGRIDEDAVPTRFEDLLDPQWVTRVALARPIHLSAAWHAASLFAAKGAAPATAFFRDLESAGARFLDDERAVLKAVTGDGPPIGVLAGEVAFGARELGHGIGILIPDQDRDGAVLLPTTVAIHRRAAESARAQQLVQYLVSAPVGRRLALMSSHIALNQGSATSGQTLSVNDLRVAQPTIAETAAQLGSVRRALAGPGGQVGRREAADHPERAAAEPG